MRDGVELFTSIYIPKDSSEPHPIILTRTPYGCEPYGENAIPDYLDNPVFSLEHYIIVFQDVRGRYMSGGTFTEMTPHKTHKKTRSDVDESSDTYDTVEWLVKHIRNNNGKVGLHGISYPGFYATASLPGAHPAIKAVSPQAPVTDEFEGDDVYHRGAFFLLDNVEFINWFDMPRNGLIKEYPVINSSFHPEDAYAFYLKLGPIKNVNDSILHNKSTIWNEYINNNSKNGYWEQRDIRQHLEGIKPAVLVVGGLFDPEDMFGALKTYAAIEKQNPQNNNYLLMGPWTHGAWAKANFENYATFKFGTNTTQKFFEAEGTFFNYFLKGKAKWSQPEATVFFTGVNEWKTFKEWPSKNTTRLNLYFDSGKRISFKQPKAKNNFTQYISNPAKPVPYTSKKTGERDEEYLGADQRFLSGRPDVVSFTSAELKDGITMAGPVEAKLFVTTTGTDADFIVKVIDVLPDSVHTQQLVRAEVLRGKFRNSFYNPEPFTPGKVTEVNLVLNDVAHTFLPGHRIMVQVQSSWFPLVDLNPQKFTNIAEADEMDFKKATIRIEHNRRYPSRIRCQILPD
jgi:putative CocE/NonD family hydrolase